MKKLLALLIVMMVFAFAVAAPIARAQTRLPDRSKTWTVCQSDKAVCDFKKIQDAVDHASAGDLIRIARGVYIYEDNKQDELVYLNKDITLRGGFDENFLPPVAYRFDNDFCKRLIRAGGKIFFEPKARIYHLRADRGGTRTLENHLKSASPLHGVGDYYFALRQEISFATLFYILKRPFREICSRFHLKSPWWIPVKFIGEVRALLLAVSLYRSGPTYMKIKE